MDVLEYSVRKKTMLAKAIAGELNVSIFSMSESKFVEMLVEWEPARFVISSNNPMRKRCHRLKA